MTLRSMTGHGCGSGVGDGVAVTVEITSLNHKGRDLRLGLDPELQWLESMLIEKLTAAIDRGTVHLQLRHSVEPRTNGAFRPRINRELVRDLSRELRELGSQCGIDTTLAWGDLLTVPGVVLEATAEPPVEQIKTAVEQALQTALRQLLAEREREGRVLAAEMEKRGRILASLLARIEERSDPAMTAYRDRLRERIALLQVDLSLDDERLVKEVAFAAQRTDITEELVRLRAHVEQFVELLRKQDGEAVGRKLHFLCQEIHREINTLGAKTGETEIADLAIEFKAELERVREQCHNVA